MMNRKPIFDAVRRLRGRGFTQPEINSLDRAIDKAIGSLQATEEPDEIVIVPKSARYDKLGKAGTKLIKKWEGCHKLRADGKYIAYPDPGSSNGKPWTIGWGSTGSDVKRGTVWTKRKCDERFNDDIQRYVNDVAKAIGTSSTSDNQFDALVSFHYNTGAIFTSTLTKMHKHGDFSGAQKQFARWIYNDGKPMKGLKNRRKDEAKLYGKAD